MLKVLIGNAHCVAINPDALLVVTITTRVWW
jgi:hypothetical protein